MRLITLKLTQNEADALEYLLRRGIEDAEYHSENYPQDYDGEDETGDIAAIREDCEAGERILKQLADLYKATA